MIDDHNRQWHNRQWQQRLVNGDPSLHVHLLGIGGAGLSAIARVLYEQGIRVSGSDRQASRATQQLAGLGIPIMAEQVAENLTQLAPEQRPDLLLISSAVDRTNPERRAAEQLGIPVVKRDDFLPVLLANRQLIAVAGTAGKSTTTAMIVKVLRDAGREIGFILGAELPGYGNAAAGCDPLFVLEADEYDHMFLTLQPTMAVITNVIWDHPDCYPTAAEFADAFAHFIKRVPSGGLVITCADDPGAAALSSQRRSTIPCAMSYGLDESADLRATNIRSVKDTQQAELCLRGAPLGTLVLAVPGNHNLRNALAAVAVADTCQLPFASSAASLRNFTGVARRFEVKGIARGVTIIDDYAHHPSKVQATLAAARSRYPTQRIWAVFQPHTFSRTHSLLADFARSFDEADQVIVTDIFPARELDKGLVHARNLVDGSPHPQIRYLATLDETVAFLARQVEPGDVVVVMGAGDSYRVAEELLEKMMSDE